MADKNQKIPPEAKKKEPFAEVVKNAETFTGEVPKTKLSVEFTGNILKSAEKGKFILQLPGGYPGGGQCMEMNIDDIEDHDLVFEDSAGRKTYKVRLPEDAEIKVLGPAAAKAGSFVNTRATAAAAANPLEAAKRPDQIKSQFEPVKPIREPIKTLNEPIKNWHEPIKDWHEPIKNLQEPIKGIDPIYPYQQDPRQNTYLNQQYDPQAQYRATPLTQAAQPTQVDQSNLTPTLKPEDMIKPLNEPIKPIKEPLHEPIKPIKEPLQEPIKPKKEPLHEPIKSLHEPIKSLHEPIKGFDPIYPWNQDQRQNTYLNQQYQQRATIPQMGQQAGGGLPVDYQAQFQGTTPLQAPQLQVAKQEDVIKPIKEITHEPIKPLHEPIKPIKEPIKNWHEPIKQLNEPIKSWQEPIKNLDPIYPYQQDPRQNPYVNQQYQQAAGVPQMQQTAQARYDIPQFPQQISKQLEPIKQQEPTKQLEPIKRDDPVKSLEPVKQRDPVKQFDPIKRMEPINPYYQDPRQNFYRNQQYQDYQTQPLQPTQSQQPNLPFALLY